MNRPPAGTAVRGRSPGGLAWLLGVLLLGEFGLAQVQAAADELPERITIGTWNLEWFFDHYRGDNHSDLARRMAAPSREAWLERVQAAARVIAAMRPTILALQEIENRDVAFRLCQELEQQHQLQYRIAFIPGTDFATEQQVAVLYQSGLIEYSRREQSKEMFASQAYANVHKHIFAEFEWGTGQQSQRLTVVNVHFKATPESADVRQRQARLVRTWLADRLAAGAAVVVVGDFNAEQAWGREADGSEMQILRQPASGEVLLHDLTEYLPEEGRMTHVSGRSFDRILVSPPLLADEPDRRDLVFATIHNFREHVVRGEPDRDSLPERYQIPQAERDVSDHYPLLAEFTLK